MGQCMSRKAAGAFAASATVAHNKPTKGNKHAKLLSPEDDNRDAIITMKKSNHNITSKGVSTSFGFKRRPTTAPSALTTDNANAARRLAYPNEVDSNGNDEERKRLIAHAQPSGRSTPRLQPPKKEGIASQKVSRFGFRQPQINRTNKVADLNAEPIDFSTNKNSNHLITATTNGVSLQNKYKAGNIGVGVRKTSTATDKNSNPTSIVKTSVQANEINRYTLQTNQLPKPQPVRVMETKTAKTLANNNVKLADTNYRRSSPDYSSKDGSLTEDSGVGSHIGADFENCTQSPLVRRNKHRNLEIMLNGNTFDVREMEDSVEVTLPNLPNVFGDTPDKSRVFQNTGVVRDRTLEYERQLDKEVRRKVSGTSSEGFSDQSCQNDNSAHKSQFITQKSFIKPKPSPVKVFLKSKAVDNKGYSSSASSDEQEWAFAGEAMADEVSFTISSSDESKDKDVQVNKSNCDVHSNNKNKVENKLFIKKSLPLLPLKTEFQPITLTIKDTHLKLEDAAISNEINMLEDESSPIESVLCFTESNEILKKKTDLNSFSPKDINEKQSSSSPSTPTNASNSLSFSDGKDDFLIDDEIADQPALVFGDKSQHNSETTLIESTPRSRRKKLRNFDGSPLILKDKKSLRSSTVSLDTLSPCDSIASDDLMMDFDYSQSSGLEEYDKMEKKTEKIIYSGDDNSTITAVNSIETDIKNNEQMRDWSALINYANGKNSKSNSRPRFLRSRTGTPNNASDSPSSLDSRHRSRPSTTNSPLRRVAHASSLGYESDDSVVKLDRATHAFIKNDIISVKTMLLKLRRVLNEQTNGDLLSMSETHNPFESQSNGHFNGFSSEANSCSETEEDSGRLELMDLRRQVLFLQGQLEDKESTVKSLQEQMTKMCVENYLSNSAPASTMDTEKEMCNAATQTERIRPVSVGPSSNGSEIDSTPGSLVSATELPRKNRTASRADLPSQRVTPTRERRKIGESPLHSAQRLTNSTSIPRRSESRSRVAPSTFT